MEHNRFVKEVLTVKKIYEPVKMNHIELKNRLIRSATWEGIANPDGSVTSEAYEIYQELAKGGIGAIITGFTSVALHDYYFGGMMRLCDDALIPQYKKLTDIIHAEGIPVITQLALGAYYREVKGRYIQVEPDDMTSDEIQYVIRQFIDAAIRADKAGFDGVQIHAAHFFFLSRFISPAVNHRTDVYGGSTENRARILLDIMNGIREAAPSLHITIKINSSDFTYGGLEEPECLAICRLLDQAGIDSIEVSGNGTSVGGIRAHVNEPYLCRRGRKAMNTSSFKADDLAEPLQSNSGEEKVLELSAAVQCGGIENDVVMDVGSVCMSGYRKGMISLGEAHGQLIAEPVCFLRGDLSRLEGLPDLIGNDISFVFLPGDLLVLPLGKQELHRRCLRIAGIGRDQFTLLSLHRVLRVVQAFIQALGHSFSFVNV